MLVRVVVIGLIAAVALALPGPSVSATSSPYRAFTTSSYWNTPLPAEAPRHPNSAAIINFLKQDNVRDGCPLLSGAGSNTWGVPVYWAEPTDPTYNVQTTRYTVPPEFGSLRIPAGAQPMRASDGEMVVYDKAKGYVAMLSKAAYDSSTDRWTVSGGSISYLASNGLEARVAGSDEPRNIGTFRGYSGASAVIRHDEVTAGQLARVLKVGVKTSNQTSLLPMWGSDGKSSDALAPPQGARIRIRPDVDLSAYKLHPQALPIARALQTHGMVVADTTGAPVELKLEDTVVQNRGQLWSLAQDALCSIPLDLYEVIDYGYVPPVGSTAPDAPSTAPLPGTDPSPLDPIEEITEPILDPPTTEPDPGTSEPTDDQPLRKGKRVGGKDRVKTAVAVASYGWSSTETVVIARADDPADALAGSALAGRLDAPLLVNPSTRLDDSVAEAVTSLGARRAVLLGGEAALRPVVAAALEDLGLEVHRVAGRNRVETAVAIGEQLRPDTDATALLVSGDPTRGWADALASAGVAATRAKSSAWPVLVAGETLPSATLDALRAWDISKVVLVGGRASLPDRVADALRSAGFEVERLSGENRYATSRSVVSAAGLGAAKPLVLATGDAFADGLAAGALTARLDGTLLLVPGTRIDEAHLSWLADHREQFSETIVVGGTAAVSDQALSAVETLLAGG